MGDGYIESAHLAARYWRGLIAVTAIAWVLSLVLIGHVFYETGVDDGYYDSLDTELLCDPLYTAR